MPSLKIKVLLEGEVLVEADKLPTNFFRRTRRQQIAWVQNYWDKLPIETIAAMIKVYPDDALPECIEDEKGTVLARSLAWKAYCVRGSAELVPIEEEE